MMKNSWIFFVFLIIVISGLGSAFSGLIIPLLIFYIIYKATTKNNAQKNTRRRSSPQRQPRSRLSARQSEAVNEALTRYFCNHEKLPLLEEISLCPEKAEYTGLRNLILMQGDDCVSTLEEFGDSYPKLYNEILRLLVEFSKQPQSEADAQPQKEAQRRQEETQDPVQKSRADEYIEQINSLNIEIDDESITNGLYQTCSLLKHLSLAEQRFPENRDKLDKLYQYYLPILMDILENYKNINDTAQNHEDFHEAQDRLNKTIILINEAMKTISATMADEDLMSLSADMTTLEALLKKDGLVQEGTMSSVRK